MTQVLTSSTLQDFLQCRRKWWLGHVRELRKVREYSTPLSVGNLYHDALAEYYNDPAGADRRNPADKVIEEAARMVQLYPEHLSAIEKDSELALIMVEGYVQWVEEEGIDEGFEFVEPESVVEVPLVKGIVLKAKLDGKVAMGGDIGWTALLEHKTVANFVELEDIAPIHFQFRTYSLVDYLRHLRDGTVLKTDGVLLNMARKVKRTASAKPPFYMRTPVRYNEDTLRAHAKHILAIAAQMQDAETRLELGEDHHAVVPPSPDKDCRWKCDFFMVCPMFDDGSDVEYVIEGAYETVDPLERYKVDKVDPVDA